MKKQVSTITIALALFSSFAAFSQEKKIPCVTYEAMEQRFAQDPAARINFEASQKALMEASESSASGAARPAAVEYTIPVVFHILHMGGPENISDAQCIAALKQINDDYGRKSSDTNQIFQPFKSKYINSDIKFMLAKKDPNGNCINGIVRHIDPKTNWSQSQAVQSFYWTYTWDPTRYLNIYVVADISPQGTVTGGGIIVGYTYLPGTWPTGNAHDAIVYRSSFLGTNFPIPDSRSLSHEMGHWLGLPHTFGNTNNPGVSCGDDGITDTPVTKGNFATCPAASTNTSFVCSSPGPGGVYYQNVENFMDYSNCAKNFTQGQTTVMRNTLSSATSGRQNLSTTQNISFTDVNGIVPCAPVAEFLSSNGSYTTCAGSSLTFKDFSYNGTITSYQWQVDNGGLIATANASQTSINFPVVGVYNVSLTVSNSQGSSTKMRIVNALDGTAAITGPHFESFESGLPSDWSIVDVDNDSKTWQNTNQAFYDGAYCMYIDGSQQPNSTSDILQMPLIDVKNNQANILDFSYAYRRQTSTQNDVLKIQGSRDCGGTWDDIVVLPASTMAQFSGGVSTDPYYPQTIDEWKTYRISDHPKWLNYYNSSSVLIRFNFVEGTAGFGNNIFIDMANWVSLTGVNELTKKVSFGMYPNPTTGEFNVHFTLSDASQVKVNIVDVLGKEVASVKNEAMPAGEQNLSINANNTLSQGIYFVNLSINGATMSGKLIVK